MQRGLGGEKERHRICGCRSPGIALAFVFSSLIESNCNSRKCLLFFLCLCLPLSSLLLLDAALPVLSRSTSDVHVRACD